YRELNERVNRLARTLRSHGISQGRLVAIMAERSIEMVVGILAAHKAGAAYVPIDPEYPEERIRFLIEDSGAQVMLTQSRLRERLAGVDSLILLDDESFYHE
ncbi:AMP-binding protein, partial [Clostridioides difficile]